MKVKVASPIRFYNGEKLVGETNYNDNAFAYPHIEITEEDIAMTYKDAGDEIIKIRHNFDDYLNNFDDYLKRHPEIWQSLADKLWDGFVDYKDIPFGNKEIWHEQKN